ncbi:MAG: hypothetical protein S4CHLAM2_10870 [Chlamydiales bacterium]|nr:hypothetical protein [Chlamydiales bacterium]
METFFFIADISGYTRYMLTNQRSTQHGKLSISLLIESLVKEIDFPLKISKLEGDAIFLYLNKKVSDPLWLSRKLFAFFAHFENALQKLKGSTACTCGGCKNIDKLSIKVIGHYGHAAIEKIGPFEELSGVDIIILHRLLKNHVPIHRYLLLTEAAYQHMEVPDTVKVSKREEDYDDVGLIPVYLFEPPEVPYTPVFVSPFRQNLHGFYMKMRDLLDKWGFKRLGSFRNLP